MCREEAGKGTVQQFCQNVDYDYRIFHNLNQQRMDIASARHSSTHTLVDSQKTAAAAAEIISIYFTVIIYRYIVLYVKLGLPVNKKSKTAVSNLPGNRVWVLQP